jgi:hypothetical protein
VNARGEYGSRAPRLGRGAAVGFTLYHTVGERADAVKQMALDWEALYQDLSRQVGYTIQNNYDTTKYDPTKVAWWNSYAHPLIKQWVKFKQDQLGGLWTVGDAYIAFTERAMTNWDVYESWMKKLEALRADAQKRGFTITASAPTALPTTVWADAAHAVERGAGAVWSGAGDVWSLVKYGAWAVLGIGAVIALSSVASNLRSGKDPAEKYVDLVRRRPRALPSSPRYALPPGDLAMEGA